MFSQFNFKPQPNYRSAVFNQSALHEIKSLLSKHRSIACFISRYLDDLVDNNLAGRQWESLEL